MADDAPPSLVAALRADRFLLGATLALGLVCCGPIFVTPYLPLHDLPDHVGAAALMKDVLRGDTVAAAHYRVQALPVPYWILYLLLAAGSALLGPLLAAKAVVALAVVLLPLGMMRLALALGRDPRLGLLGFALAWDNNMIWGFVAYELGLGLLFFALASLARASELRAALRAGGWGVLVALTHAQAFGILGWLAAAVVGRAAPSRRRPLLWAAGLAPGVVVLLPWIVARALDGGGGPRPERWLEMHAIETQLERVLGYSTGVLGGPVGPFVGRAAFIALATAPVALGLAALRRAGVGVGASLVLSGALVYGLIVHEDGRFAAGALMGAGVAGALLAAGIARGDPHRFAAAGLVVLSAALYLAFPMGMSWPIEQWFIYPRHAVVFLAVCAVAPAAGRAHAEARDRPRAEGWLARDGLQGGRALALLPGVLAAVLLAAVAINRFADFGTRAAPFRQVVDAAGEQPRLLTLTLHDHDPAIPYHPFNQFHAYVVAARGGYDPYLFDNPSTPFVHTEKLPHPPWNQMNRFELAAHGQHYDHILVQGRDVMPGRPPPPGKTVHKVAQAGRWTLYRLRPAATSSAAP